MQCSRSSAGSARSSSTRSPWPAGITISSSTPALPITTPHGDLLYERREVFEAFNKGLALVPTEEFPWFRAMPSESVPRILVERAEVAEQVLKRIWAEGPLSVLDSARNEDE